MREVARHAKPNVSLVSAVDKARYMFSTSIILFQFRQIRIRTSNGLTCMVHLSSSNARDSIGIQHVRDADDLQSLVPLTLDTSERTKGGKPCRSCT